MLPAPSSIADQKEGNLVVSNPTIDIKGVATRFCKSLGRADITYSSLRPGGFIVFLVQTVHLPGTLIRCGKVSRATHNQATYWDIIVYCSSP